MNERKLRSRLHWIVKLGAPVALLASACGGATEPGGGGGAAGEPEMGGTGGTSTGGTSTGGTSTGGTSTGGSPNCQTQGGGSVGSDCTNTKFYEIDAACVAAPLTDERCKELCNTSWSTSLCSFSESTTAGKVMLRCAPTCVAGRRPAGFVEEATAEHGVAAYFARMAELEAAAIPAFRHLHTDLHEHGAPRPLLRALSRAARDERRHARATSALARRHGARVSVPRVPPRRSRSLEAIALENVAEGCVRELFGALVATFQAEHAGDPEVRRVMKRIAHEETRHAALSLQVQSWLEQRLDRTARERVRTAREHALSELAAELRREVDTALVDAAGLPSTRVASALYRALFSATDRTMTASARR